MGWLIVRQNILATTMTGITVLTRLQFVLTECSTELRRGMSRKEMKCVQQIELAFEGIAAVHDLCTELPRIQSCSYRYNDLYFFLFALCYISGNGVRLIGAMRTQARNN